MENTSTYQDFIGKHKKEIIVLMGSDEFNYYPSQRWTYYVKKNWLGQKVFIVIHFDDDLVINIEILKTYRK